MKKSVNLFQLIILSLIAVHSVNVRAAAEENILKTEISRVIVYPNGALVTRDARTSLTSGETILTVSGLSPYINEQSVRVKGKGKFTILSVSSEKNFMKNLAETEKMNSLRTQLRTLTDKLGDEQMHLDLLNEKESFLTSNKVIGGKDQSLDAGNFKSLYDFYSTNMQQIREGILEKTRSIAKLKDEQAKVQQEINQLQSVKELPSGVLEITVKADAQTEAVFTINYLVNNAGWYPSYDLRVDNLEEPAELVYKANVYQTTGVEWNKVLLSFSNATPDRSGNIPVLFPWYVDFQSETSLNVRGYAMSAQKAAPAAAEMNMSRVKDETPGELPEALMVGTITSERTTSIEFNIDVPYTIASVGKPKSIDMMRLSLPASYTYQTVPALDNEAFLVAGIYNWEQYDLLPGEASIYFENTYIGKSMLDVRSVKDTLNISLGRDQSIVIKREKQKDYTSNQFIGGNRIESRSFEISIRNTKKIPVNILVKDQIPVSKNKDITVTATNLSNGKLDDKTGIIEWSLTVKPGETQKLTLGYAVKYPKDRKISF